MGQVLVKVRGLHTYPSEVSQIPDGALLVADNVVIDRESVLEQRSGFDNYATLSASSSDRTKQLFSYKDTLLVHYATTLKRDNGSGTLTAYTGSFSEPSHNDSYVPKIKSAELNSNFYFTTNSGIYKLDTLTSTPSPAGMPKGLDTSLTLNGASGFMANNTQVAYRTVWARKDANNNLILGAPGQRTIIVNTSGGSRNISLVNTIPQEILVTDFLQVYRSGQSVDANTEPNDELGLVYEVHPTAGEITARSLTFIDSTTDDLRGTTIYTAASQEGIAQANDVPPQAKDITIFKNCAFLANTITKQRLNLTMLSAYGSSGVNYRAFTGDISSGTNTILNASSTTGLSIGQSITGVGIAANTTILNIVGTTLTISINATATTVGVSLEAFDVITIAGVSYKGGAAENVATLTFQVFSAGTPAQNIADTTQSLVRVINRNATNTTVYAYYLSQSDDLPGKILIESRALGTVSFSAIASSHGSAWNPVLPLSGTTISSATDAYKNGLYISKEQRPEAFPLLQFLRMGASDEPILRILPLRESLIIMKSDGVYRLTGESPANFIVDILDNTVFVTAPETAVKLNNQIYAFTNQGICTISDTGVAVISRSIEDKIRFIPLITNFDSISHAVSYETAHKYIIFLPTSTTDTYATQEFVFNTFTGAWTRWTRTGTAALNLQADDKLYFGSGTINKILKERKTNSYTDYADETTTITISSVSGADLTLSSVSGLNLGDAVTQGVLPWSTITAINTTTNVITVSPVRAFTAASASAFARISSIALWAPQYMGAPGMMKQVRDFTLLTKDRRFKECILIFSSNLSRDEIDVDIQGFVSFLWGYFPWGGIPWGGGNPPDRLRTYIPSESQRCDWLNVKFTHSQAYQAFGIEGYTLAFNMMSERTGN